MLSIWILTFFAIASRYADIKAIRSSVGSSRSFAVRLAYRLKKLFAVFRSYNNADYFTCFRYFLYASFSFIRYCFLPCRGHVSGVRSSLFECLAIFAIPSLKSATTSSDTSGISSVCMSSCELPLPTPLQHPGVQLAPASLSVCGVSGAKVSFSSLIK